MTRPHGPVTSIPYELLALADELGQAATSAHNRICDTYLACFGGLDAGLPGLAEDPGAAEIDGGYPLRHLARHLCHAGRAADLHALLAVEHPAGADHAVNTWFAAHDHADSIVSYLDDLARPAATALPPPTKTSARHRPAATLGMEIRYALMAASIASFTANISADLLGQLIRAGLWSPRHGLDHARRITDPSSRLEALLTVRSQLNAEEQPAVLAQALAAATAITDDSARAQALAGLAPHLPTDEQPAVLAQALAAATAITSDSDRAQALAGLAPHLPPTCWPRRWPPPPPSPTTPPAPRRWPRWRPTCPRDPPSWPRHWPPPPPSPTTTPGARRWPRWRPTCHRPAGPGAGRRHRPHRRLLPRPGAGRAGAPPARS